MSVDKEQLKEAAEYIRLWMRRHPNMKSLT